jgi:catechol 2,3-dioxygenase-like lactoylglutathione lyase family enzyme
MLIAYWHFSFTVADIDRSVEFYTKVIGMEVVHTQEQANEYTSRLVGYENAHLKVAQLHIPALTKQRSGHLLELVEYVNPRCDPTDTATCRPGSAHLAFQVADIHKKYEEMIAAGVRFKSPPNAITAGINKGGFTCYFLDPDDITLEIIQAPSIPHPNA